MELKDLEILEYCEEMGPVLWPAGFERELEGKRIEEQLACYGVLDGYRGPLSYHLSNWAGLTEDGQLQALEEYCGWEKLILREGLVVGFVRYGRTILPYQVVAEDSDSDNNGAGYKERTYYFYLVCVPYKRDRERTFAPPFGAPAPELTVPVIGYDGSRGADPLPEGFSGRLEGKPLSAQMFYFAIHKCNPGPKTGWEDDWHKYGGFYLADLCRGRGGYLPFREDVQALIVHQGRIVGVRVRLPEDTVGAHFADLYPYEEYTYHYRYPYSTTEYPARLQLYCVSLPG